MNRDPTSKAKEKRIVLVAGLLAGVYALGSVWAMTLPYLYTALSFAARVYIVLPILLALFGYLIFIKKASWSGKTPFRMYFDAITPGVPRIKYVFWTVSGVIFGAAGLAWISIAFPIWMTVWTASEPYARVFKIEEIISQGGALWTRRFELKLKSGETGEVVKLSLRRRVFEQNNWKIGDVLCAKGRTSAFGTLIEQTAKELEFCQRQ